MQAAIYSRFGNLEPRLRAALYARYSSDNQRYESITAQLRCSKEYCASKHYDVVKIYTDEAISGTSVAGRAGFQQMILDSADDVFDVVIFHKIDRNARNEIDYYTNIDRLKKNGVKYEYSAEGIDVSTANGKLTEGIKVAVAAWYSRNLAQEVKKGQKENALKAVFNGGRPPLGYKIINQQYYIEPKEAEAVRLIFAMYLAGNGYTKISEELNRRGFLTRNGQPFAKNSLYEILGNERYTGVYIFNRILTDEFGKRNNHRVNPDAIKIDNAIPAIIDKATFQAAAAMRAKNRQSNSRCRTVEKYLLAGKIYCALCGRAMSGHRMRTRSGIYTYYCCNKTRLPADVKCQQKLVKKDYVERNVCEGVLEIVMSDECREKTVAEMVECYSKLDSTVKTERKTLNATIRAAEAKLSNLYALVEGGTFDEFDAKRIAGVKAEIREAKNKLQSLPDTTSMQQLNPEKLNSLFAEMYERLNAKVQEGNIEVMQMIINAFVDKVVVYGDGIGVTIKVSPGQLLSAETVEPHLHHVGGYIELNFWFPKSALGAKDFVRQIQYTR